MSAVSTRPGPRRRRRRRSNDPEAGNPPRFWGRIGAYEAVTREGVLFLLSPEPAHPSLRVKSGT